VCVPNVAGKHRTQRASPASRWRARGAARRWRERQQRHERKQGAWKHSIRRSNRHGKTRIDDGEESWIPHTLRPTRQQESRVRARLGKTRTRRPWMQELLPCHRPHRLAEGVRRRRRTAGFCGAHARSGTRRIEGPGHSTLRSLSTSSAARSRGSVRFRRPVLSEEESNST
jgi:hypothetical protein